MKFVFRTRTILMVMVLLSCIVMPVIAQAVQDITLINIPPPDSSGVSADDSVPVLISERSERFDFYDDILSPLDLDKIRDSREAKSTGAEKPGFADHVSMIMKMEEGMNRVYPVPSGTSGVYFGKTIDEVRTGRNPDNTEGFIDRLMIQRRFKGGNIEPRRPGGFPHPAAITENS